ncbi:MAG: tetratricopeptide repeat protein [Phaeodactylibacter sp.]|nr:tetratricopeptide repeat protein [Phaeodactylibacter sp.]
MKEKDHGRIEDYLYGRMSAEETAIFERELKEDEELARAVQLERLEKQALRLLSQDMLREEMAGWKAEKEQREAAPVKIRPLLNRRLFLRLGAAAAVLLLLGMPFWWANRNYNNTALAGNTLGIQTSLSDRSNIPSGSPLLPALELAGAQDYDAAIAQLQQLQGTAYEAQAELLMGEIYTEQENYEAAIGIYTRLAEGSADPAGRQKAEWLLSNVYLATGREAEARSLLEQIAGDNAHMNQQEAKALLKELNSIWRRLVF